MSWAEESTDLREAAPPVYNALPGSSTRSQTQNVTFGKVKGFKATENQNLAC